jgi:hypothetical protein
MSHMPKISNVIVTNCSALQAKYQKHYQRVSQAIDALIKADGDRGITTRLVAFDDGPTMKRMGGTPGLDPEDLHGSSDAHYPERVLRVALFAWEVRQA